MEHELPSQIFETASNDEFRDDPVNFISRFRESSIYAEAYEGFYEGKEISLEATEEIKSLSFHGSRAASDALLEFYLSEEDRFRYNPDHFSDDSRKAIADYIEKVEEEKQFADQDTRHVNDSRRTVSHVKAGESMMKDGIVSTVRMGRMLARIILADQGVEDIEKARQMQ